VRFFGIGDDRDKMHLQHATKSMLSHGAETHAHAQLTASMRARRTHVSISNYTGVWPQRRHLLAESKTEEQRAGLVGTYAELEVSATGVSICVLLY